ncbi:MAG: OmpA family protein [Bacteroidetes bacterium]|nr:OmpA family protein [Bacteroidota bacterium]
MRKKNKKHAEESGSDRWLLTYSDLITLLLGLFVILYAMSNIDTKKYAQLVEAFGGVFGSNTLDLQKGIGQKGLLEGFEEQLRIEKLLDESLGIKNGDSRISVTMNERGVTVHIQEELLFSSGESQLKRSSYQTLDSLAKVLSTLPNEIRVEGHTDNVPIHSAAFPSNWHLSVGRAINTAFYMMDKYQLDPERVSVVGYGENKPVAPNDTEAHRALNRRVDIVILMSQLTQTLNQQRQQALHGE